MSKWRDIYFQADQATTWKEIARRPTAKQTIERLIQESRTQYPPLRVIGYSDADGEVTISQESRESHIHILGAPGEGKSKFLEMMISLDIEALISGKSKSGACFIDSSDNGNTLKKVLKYCAHRKFEKVLLIDPHNIQDFGYVTPINPIHYNAPSEAVQSHIGDCLRVLWDTKSFSDEAIITTFLPYVIDAIHSAGATLPDSECLTIPELKSQQLQLLNNDKLAFTSRMFFNRVYKKERAWMEFQSTCRRLNPFYHSVMKLTLGSVKGVSFSKLITEGWVILVNLYEVGLFEDRHQKLLGTMILNEIILAMSRIKHKTPSYGVPYYIYVDEFGKYATRKISNLLRYSRQSGIRMNLAHQDFEQIDPAVMAAVKADAKTKVLFYVTEPDDRHKMVRHMYGGDLPDRAVEYTLSQTKKQNAVIKINKQPPSLIRIRDWPDAPVTDKQLNSFIEYLYKNNPMYRPKADVWEEIKTRFAVSTSSSESSIRRTPPKAADPKKTQPPRNDKPQATTGDTGAKPDTGQDRAGALPQSILDDIANRQALLRDKKRRGKGKSDDPTPAPE